MLSLDPHPMLLLIVPLWAGIAYVTHRGLVRNEFRLRGRWEWKHFETWTLDWAISTVTNFVFLGVCTALAYAATFHGSTF